MPTPATLSRATDLRRAIFWSGLVAGSLDILFVIVFYGAQGVPAQRILQSVAAGALGREAAQAGGWGTALLGLGFHFLIAYAFAAAFCLAASRWPRLLQAPWLVGPLYGVVVWLVMQRVVLPFTAVPPASFPPPRWMPVFIAHLTVVGPPIVLLARRWLKPAGASAIAR